MAKFAVLLPAAGKSTRFGDKEKKIFQTLDNRPIWLRTAELFITRDDVCQVIVIISPEDEEKFRSKYAANLAFMDIEIALGGKERFESVANALQKLKDDAEFVAIHDAVRPCLNPELIPKVFSQAQKSGAAILAVPVADTVKEANPQQQVTGTRPRTNLWLAQTPQVFRRDWLEAAYANRGQLQQDITDDAQLIEAAGHTVEIVEGDRGNIKITTKPDLYLADAILKSRPKPKANRPFHPFAEEEMWGGRG